jgi:hypothetical protein
LVQLAQNLKRNLRLQEDLVKFSNQKELEKSNLQQANLNLILGIFVVNLWNLYVELDKHLQTYYQDLYKPIHSSNLELAINELRTQTEAKPQAEPIKEVESFYIGLSETELKQMYHKLVKGKFLKPSHESHFVNAFNGCKRKEGSFECITWYKAVYAHLFIKINIDDIDNPKNKVWQRAEKFFNNGKAVSLKNAVKSNPINLHKKYKYDIEELIKSLQ